MTEISGVVAPRCPADQVAIGQGHEAKVGVLSEGMVNCTQKNRLDSEHPP